MEQALEVQITTPSAIKRNQHQQGVKFAGISINLSEISRSHGIHVSHISRILSGKRVPSVDNARKIAASLGMGLEQFLYALERHIQDNTK